MILNQTRHLYNSSSINRTRHTSDFQLLYVQIWDHFLLEMHRKFEVILFSFLVAPARAERLIFSVQCVCLFVCMYVCMYVCGQLQFNFKYSHQMAYIVK